MVDVVEVVVGCGNATMVVIVVVSSASLVSVVPSRPSVSLMLTIPEFCART